jgi:pimeloyl-ACP methyl ester carboxylesterase
VFIPALHYDFLRYDDEKYVYENPHISPLNGDNVLWIMTHGYFNSYAPLALLSHAIDFRIWKLDARGHHLTSNLLHALIAGWVLFLSAMVGSRKGLRSIVEQWRSM